ncbi:hypothetical protein WBP07_22105 (plasmid) [Novosphingobium sp. BL-8A]|uniref:hypothetical protein n=1 Tax=Novosphingobium sp. BL-8A TaxID=3127639 RepID=UPI003756E246
MMLVDAMRCWSEARRAGEPVQPRLSHLLGDQDCAMLTPVFDSLIRLYEIVLERPIQAGSGPVFSEDEHLLLDLVGGRFPRKACLSCHKEIGTTVDCAICSTRIMMALTVPIDTPYLEASARLR